MKSEKKEEIEENEKKGKEVGEEEKSTELSIKKDEEIENFQDILSNALYQKKS